MMKTLGGRTRTLHIFLCRFSTPVNKIAIPCSWRVVIASEERLPKVLRRSLITEAKHDQVAAVCYRREAGSTQFLLVRTTGGRWTFPKGRLEDGLLPAEVAALEALEEGGVVGKIDPRPIGKYLHRKTYLHGPRELTVLAFLLEVRKTARPAEAQRRPQWFTPIEAKRRLCQRRSTKYLAGIEDVLDSALMKIAHEPSQQSWSGLTGIDLWNTDG